MQAKLKLLDSKIPAVWSGTDSVQHCRLDSSQIILGTRLRYLIRV